MKLICLLLILFVLPLYAQDNCDYQLYVDTLHGFSMEIPQNQQIIKDISHKDRYEAKESGKILYSIYVESKTKFFEYYIGDALQEIKLDVDQSDTLLAVATVKCRNKFFLRHTGVTSFYRIDSLIQWPKYNDLRIIEYQRTLVFEKPNGSLKYEIVGPMFFVELFSGVDGYILEYDFSKYIKTEDYNTAKKIVSSIKVLE